MAHDPRTLYEPRPRAVIFSQQSNIELILNKICITYLLLLHLKMKNKKTIQMNLLIIITIINIKKNWKFGDA